MKFFFNDISLIFWGIQLLFFACPPYKLVSYSMILLALLMDNRPWTCPGRRSTADAGVSCLQEKSQCCQGTLAPGSTPGSAASSTAFTLTFEEDDLVVTGSLVDRVQAVQVERQAPPETVDLSRLEGDQVLIASQSPEVLAWRNRLDITEPHCNPPAPGERRVPGTRRQQTAKRVRWELCITGVLLSSRSC